MSETKNTWKDKLYETDNPLIEVEELDLDYQTAKGCVNALSHINFSIHRVYGKEPFFNRKIANA